MSLSNHISYLLLTCRSVTVPGFGSFSASHEKANFDSFDGTFYPSRIRIRFSKCEDENNDLLQVSLSRKLKITSSEASLIISQFISKIQSKLKKSGYCRLEGIGYLITKSNGTLVLQDTFWRRTRPSSLSC